MYWIFLILGLLLLLFKLEPIPGRPSHNHYALIWEWKQYQLIRIMPQDWYVLVDARVLFLYTDMNSLDTYITAVRLDTHREYKIFHYRYLMDWIKQPPVIKSYPSNLQDVVVILNHVTSSL
ncbi:hypothetical protein JTE90_003910 [Oedothorax gibbosus]|uniref:Uncharacterized protein n=1 Tax=Oedothorax gibbosus TaxID=931172 RepID=A0AAV6TMD9_9ARAC|nr:hypothetical protein JTE90_003910 [Oedothorax gibbosus]